MFRDVQRVVIDLWKRPPTPYINKDHSLHINVQKILTAICYVISYSASDLLDKARMIQQCADLPPNNQPLTIPPGPFPSSFQTASPKPIAHCFPRRKALDRSIWQPYSVETAA